MFIRLLNVLPNMKHTLVYFTLNTHKPSFFIYCSDYTYTTYHLSNLKSCKKLCLTDIDPIF